MSASTAQGIVGGVEMVASDACGDGAVGESDVVDSLDVVVMVVVDGPPAIRRNSLKFSILNKHRKSNDEHTKNYG